MSDDNQHADKNAQSVNHSDQRNPSQVNDSADVDTTNAPRRPTLWARIEAEREARAQRHQASLANTFRNLFGQSHRR